MEKWFDLADVIPSANPYNGQDTGRSLANIYKSMLNEMTIKNIDDQGEQILSFYNEALDYLNEVVKHPENLTRTATRLALYNEYKELYSDLRLEMEDKIEMKRRSLQYTEYELPTSFKGRKCTSGGGYSVKRSSVVFTLPFWTLVPLPSSRKKLES